MTADVNRQEQTPVRVIPYPLRAAKISIDFSPFHFWWKPALTVRSNLPERPRANGETIWWARWGFFQISYSRWL